IAPEMVFRLGSVTKQFTAVAILMLVEAGQIKLDDEITRYLSDYSSHGQTITVEHLLTHTSGIKNFVTLPAWVALQRQDLTPTELIALFANEPLDFPPGTQWSYSNSNYILLGAIIEQLSGLSYADFIQQHIFTPLGMTHSAYDQTEHILPGRVAGYVRDADGFQNAPYLSMSHPYAAGALVSSVDDLAKWDAALYTDKLVKQRTLQRAFRGFRLTDGEDAGYGYGFQIADYEGHRMLTHAGTINGFTTWMLRLPEDKVYVAILTNCENCSVDLNELTFNIATMVIGKPYRDPTAITLPTSTLAAYEGIYVRPDGSELVVRVAGEQLQVQITGIPPLPLVPYAPNAFFIKDAKIRLRFIKGASDQVTGVQMQSRFGPWRLGQKTDK
ncbi:MAG: serine hydrolase, partial [Caldilineaceae bacterium]|nr:serine hydrolase [Caldilineaceae bacterium]